MAFVSHRIPRFGFLAGLICSLAFIGLSFWAGAGHYLPGEENLLSAIVAHRHPALNLPALVLSFLGSANFILPVWLLIAAWFGFRRDWPTFLRFLPLPLGYVLYIGIKSIVARPGPAPDVYPWLYDLSPGYFLEGLFHRQLQVLPAQGISVPVAPQPITAAAVTQVVERGYVSGHALMAGLLYGTIAGLCWRKAGRSHLLTFGFIGALMLTALIGIARLYMAVHFPSDVLGAWLLALVVLILIDETVKRRFTKRPPWSGPEPDSPSARS